VAAAGADGEAGAAKKKKKKKKKKPAGAATAGGAPITKQQTDPPTVPLRRLFPPGGFPEGERQPYPESQRWRETDAERRDRARRAAGSVEDARQAAEVHRQARAYAHTIAVPGIPLIDLCEKLEARVRTLVDARGLEAGVAFPTGCSLNHVAAHYTPNAGDKTVLAYDDVMKLDFGVHVGGRIIDSAFTIAHNPRHAALLATVREATETGIRGAGVDARVAEIGAAVQEVMEAGEVELDGKVHRVKALANLNGHSIERYRIHGGKSVPIVAGGDESVVMEEGEFYAIETFGSVRGRGRTLEDGEVSHYMRRFDAERVPLRNARQSALLGAIDRNFSTLAFCRRYLDRLGEERYLLALKGLCDAGAVDPYPPLVEREGAFVAQYEHTLFLHYSGGKEVLSRGDDY
jgi:methionyl aminopeptidase